MSCPASNTHWYDCAKARFQFGCSDAGMSSIIAEGQWTRRNGGTQASGGAGLC